MQLMGKLIHLRVLLCGVLVILGAGHLVLWNFLHLPGFVQALGYGVLVALGAGVWFSRDWVRDENVSLGALLVCFGVALIVLLLGGEGRLFYANWDWQVRYSILHDLAKFEWPFVYLNRGEALLLRAPLGMYLAPAVAGKIAGTQGAEVALLLQNTVLLGLIFAIASLFWKTLRQRCIALVVFLLFSGMDIFGQLLMDKSPWLHLEGWARIQYSSHITQLFWAPNHALPGWLFVVLFVLYQNKQISKTILYFFSALLPLFSPLSAIGCLPYLLYSAYGELKARNVTAWDMAIVAAAALFSVPSLVYLFGGSSAVGMSVEKTDISTYLYFILLEVLLYMIAILACPERQRFRMPVLTITIIFLLFIPFGKIGTSVDFVMRVSIPALAMLAISTADILVYPNSEQNGFLRWTQIFLLVVLTIGSFTPLGELARAILYPHSPELTCNYMEVVPNGADTYVTKLAQVPALIRPVAPHIVIARKPERCWNGSWPDAMTGEEYPNPPMPEGNSPPKVDHSFVVDPDKL
jgi:hypothetical protein